MRTTITLEPDVAAAVRAARSDSNVGISTVVNDLIRKGLSAPEPAGEVFVQQTSAMGARLDVSNVAEVLESLDGPAAA